MADSEQPSGHAAILRAAGQQIERLLAAPVPAGLHLVATPIGNLGDITFRAVAMLANADLVYCEDTRQSQKLLDRYGIRRALRSYHEHNAEAERPRILDALARGKSVALISDAGTPLVSDPGYKLVRDAIEAGHAVTALPGPSAVLAALTVAGLPTDSFHFARFPARPAGPAPRAHRGAPIHSGDARVVRGAAAAGRGAATISWPCSATGLRSSRAS